MDAAKYGDASSHLADTVREHDAVDVCIVLAGMSHFQPFGRQTKQLLHRSCRFVMSISPGCKPATSQSTSPSTITARAKGMTDATISLVLTSLFESIVAGQCLPSEATRRIPFINATDAVLGIVRMGEVGKVVAKTAVSQGIRVKYFDYQRLDIDNEANYQAWYCHSVEELLSESDMVFNSSLIDSTEINAAQETPVRKDHIMPVKA